MGVVVVIVIGVVIVIVGHTIGGMYGIFVVLSYLCA